MRNILSAMTLDKGCIIIFSCFKSQWDGISRSMFEISLFLRVSRKCKDPFMVSLLSLMAMHGVYWGLKKWRTCPEFVWLHTLCFACFQQTANEEYSARTFDNACKTSRTSQCQFEGSFLGVWNNVSRVIKWCGHGANHTGQERRNKTTHSPH